MGIVLKWNFKNLFADITRLLLSLLSIASTYALLTGLGLALTSFAHYTGTINEGLPHYIDMLGPPVVQASFAATMYVLFAVSIAERKEQYRLMRSAGCTTRQFVQSFLAEALALDVAGGLPGVALGVGIAKFQLSAVGLPLAVRAYFSSPDAARGLLPVFLLVPLTLLLASVQLWVPPKNRRRKQSRKDRPSFKKRLFPRLFGAGGRLEYALSKNERRHRWGVVFSVVANLSILFLLTAGVSALAATEAQASGILSQITVSSENTPYENAFTDINAIIQELGDEGLFKEFEFRYFFEVLMIPVKTESLSFPAEYNRYRNALRISGEMFGYRSTYRLDDEQTLLLIPLTVLDDQAFDSLAKKLKIDPGDNNAILINKTGNKSPEYEMYEGSINWDCGPIDSLQLKTLSATIWEKMQNREAAWNQMVSDAQSWEELSMEEDSVYYSIDASEEDFSEEHTKTVTLPVCCAQASAVGANFSPSMILSAHAAGDYLSVLQKGEVFNGHFWLNLKTDRPEALKHALKQAFESKDYTVFQQQFGDNESAFHRLETQINASGGSAVVIQDFNMMYKTADLFTDQAEQFFFRYFTVMIFLSIALNIVNIVHMNRLSRRREYAILTSIGLSRRQRLGMSLYESFWFTLQTVFCGSVVLVVLARILSPSASDAYEGEIFQPSVEYDVSGWYKEHAFFEKLWNTAVNLATTLRPYWVLILFTVAFLFFGYLITETLVNRKMDKDELIPTLKDDMHE